MERGGPSWGFLINQKFQASTRSCLKTPWGWLQGMTAEADFWPSYGHTKKRGREESAKRMRERGVFTVRMCTHTETYTTKVIGKQRQLQQRASQNVKILLSLTHCPLSSEGLCSLFFMLQTHKMAEVDPQPHETPDRLCKKKLERTELSRESHGLSVTSPHSSFC